MKKIIFATFVVVLCCAPALTQTIAITNAKIYPVSGPSITGTVVIRDGVIAAIGENVSVPANAQRIDATGKVVTPGLINSLSELGLIEIDQVRTTNDTSARGNNNVAAAFKVWDGLNPASALFAPARNEGITSAIIIPHGGLISGQAAAIDLVSSGRADEMVRRAAVAMVAQVDDTNAAGTTSRGELIGKLRTLFEDVKFYVEHQRDYERAASRPLSASQADLDALIPVLNGRMLLLIDANRVDEIDAALSLARDYNLKIGITGGAEAWLRADRLAAAKVPVFTGAMNNIPDSFATLNQRQENAALLRRAGVQVVITGGGDVTRYNARNIKYEAGNAVAYGMTHDDALRALTLTPAEIFGLSDRLGSLQVGRDANVVIWSGDPFEFSTLADRVFIRGREVKEPSRQDLLIERYKSKATR